MNRNAIKLLEGTVSFWEAEIAKFEERMRTGSHHPGLTAKWLNRARKAKEYHVRCLNSLDRACARVA